MIPVLAPPTLSFLDRTNEHNRNCLVTFNQFHDLDPSASIFQPSLSFTVGMNPSAVAMGDFNRDGKLDLATSNFDGNSVSVLLGNGNGTFQSSADYKVGRNPKSLAIGDFNRDGIQDVAVGNNYSNDLSILLGQGDGSFHIIINYPVGINLGIASIAISDINRDGKFDVVTANSLNSSMSVLLNDLPGDLTTNGCVDQADLEKLLSDLRGPGPHNSAYDLNADGMINIADARKLVTLFSKPLGMACD